MYSILNDFKIGDNLYKMSFNKEKDGFWYIDYPNWPFSHHNLMMVEGADEALDALLADYKSNRVTITVDISGEDSGSVMCLKTKSSLTGGAYYDVFGDTLDFPREMWLCPVTLAVFGKYPDTLGITKVSEEKVEGLY